MVSARYRRHLKTIQIVVFMGKSRSEPDSSSHGLTAAAPGAGATHG